MQNQEIYYSTRKSKLAGKISNLIYRNSARYSEKETDNKINFYNLIFLFKKRDKKNYYSNLR